MVYVQIRFASDIVSRDLVVSAKVAGFTATGWVTRHDAVMYLHHCRSVIVNSSKPDWFERRTVIANGNDLIKKVVSIFAIWKITGQLAG